MMTISQQAAEGRRQTIVCHPRPLKRRCFPRYIIYRVGAQGWGYFSIVARDLQGHFSSIQSKLQRNCDTDKSSQNRKWYSIPLMFRLIVNLLAHFFEFFDLTTIGWEINNLSTANLVESNYINNIIFINYNLLMKINHTLF